MSGIFTVDGKIYGSLPPWGDDDFIDYLPVSLANRATLVNSPGGFCVWVEEVRYDVLPLGDDWWSVTRGDLTDPAGSWDDFGAIDFNGIYSPRVGTPQGLIFAICGR